MPNAGPNSAGTGADDASVGTLSWTNPSNITAADGSVSSATNNSTALPSDTTVKLVVAGSVAVVDAPTQPAALNLAESPVAAEALALAATWALAETPAASETLALAATLLASETRGWDDSGPALAASLVASDALAATED